MMVLELFYVICPLTFKKALLRAKVNRKALQIIIKAKNIN